MNGGPCSHCGLPPTPEGHDACIANLPGVRFACCGHAGTIGYAGDIDDEGGPDLLDYCYLAFNDGLCLYGTTARWAMRMLGGNPPETTAPPVPTSHIVKFN